jgi:hypothetical protein
MDPQLYGRFLMVATFALAIWVDARWPQLAPKRLLNALIHAAASLIVSPLIVSMALHAAAGSPEVKLAMLVSVVVPAVGYTMIAAVWLIKAGTAELLKYRL